MRRCIALGTVMTVALLLLAGLVPVATAAGPSGVVITTPYPWVVAEKGKAVTFSLDIANNGQSNEVLDLQVADGPKDWNPILKSGGYSSIRQVIVAPGKSQTLDFQAEPPLSAQANDYGFSIKALGTDGSMVSDLKLKVSLQDKVSQGLQFTTQLPNVRGQAGSPFSFKMDLKNDATEDRAINFTATAPQDWEVNFKPSFDTKQVSTIRVKAGETQGVDIDVTPPQKVEAGDYTVKVAAAAGNDHAEATLKITVLGNYKLSLDTASGQLNTKATVDQPTNVTMLVKNTGASTLQNVSLSSSNPDGWNVTFNPAKIDAIPPEQQREVAVSLKPGTRALAGDYMVKVTASGQNTTDNKDLRVTVETPTTWGFAGVALIVIVLGGLGLLFARLSRR